VRRKKEEGRWGMGNGKWKMGKVRRKK